MPEQDQITECYEHLLYYDDLQDAKAVLNYIRERFDPSASLLSEDHPYYDHTITFTTDGEFEDEEAEELLQFVSPDAYDLNVPEDEKDEEGDDDEEDEDDTEEDQFPSVFTSAEREAAVAEAEDVELAIEYIRRLERVAYTAYVYYAKTCSLRGALPKASYDIASLSMDELTKALHEELASVDFMR